MANGKQCLSATIALYSSVPTCVQCTLQCLRCVSCVCLDTAPSTRHFFESRPRTSNQLHHITMLKQNFAQSMRKQAHSYLRPAHRAGPSSRSSLQDGWQGLYMSIVEKTCFFDPELVAMRPQTVEEEVERAKPCIECLWHVGAHVLDAFLFFACP